MNTKVFSERFNRELALSGFPEELSEKIKAVTKAFNVTSYLANAMIFGHLVPSDEQLDRISATLEVCPDWLCGNTDKKKAYSSRLREEAE